MDIKPAGTICKETRRCRVTDPIEIRSNEARWMLMPNERETCEFGDDASDTKNSYAVSPRGQGFFCSTIQFSKPRSASHAFRCIPLYFTLFFRIVLVAQKKSHQPIKSTNGTDQLSGSQTHLLNPFSSSFGPLTIVATPDRTIG